MSARPTYPKSTCCIMGCASWSRVYPGECEWMCGRHWKMIRPSRRRLLRKVWRTLKDIRSLSEMTREDRLRRNRMWMLDDKVWQAEKTRVTMACAGI